jgi:hypothetical protein
MELHSVTHLPAQHNPSREKMMWQTRGAKQCGYAASMMNGRVVMWKMME